MKLIIVFACLGVAWAVPSNYAQDSEGNVLPDDSLSVNFYPDVNINDADARVNIIDNVLDQSVDSLDIVNNQGKGPELDQSEDRVEVPLDNNVAEIEPNQNTFEEDDFANVDHDKNEVPNPDTLLVVDSSLSNEADDSDVRERDDVLVDAPFENIDDLHVVNLDDLEGDTEIFDGIMALAPSELDSIRVYFDEDMAREELDDQDEQAYEIPRIRYDDPNLR